MRKKTLDLHVGDWVVYRKQKFSTSPGRRAKHVSPATRGETYNYVVDKYWVVKGVLPDGEVLLRTRTGKEHVVSMDDPHLRWAKWWERWAFADRFRSASPQADAKTGE